MVDEKVWNVIVEILSVIDHSRRPNDTNTDALGRLHVILFGELPAIKKGGGCMLCAVCAHTLARAQVT